MFSGEEMMAIYWSRPSSVLPMLTSFMRRAFRREFLPVGFELGVVGDLVVVAEIEAERFFGRGNFGGRLCGQQASGQGCYNHEPGDSSFCHRCEFILIGVSLPRFGPI